MNELSGISAAAILVGFLFAGFWWSLDRELNFKTEGRHFKPAYALLLLSIAFVGYFGLVVPLREASRSPQYAYLKTTYFGVTLGLVAVLGYMLTEFAHYRIFQRLKYSTPLEWVFFIVTIGALLIVGTQLFPGLQPRRRTGILKTSNGTTWASTMWECAHRHRPIRTLARIVSDRGPPDCDT